MLQQLVVKVIDSDGRLLLTTTYSSAYDHFLPEKKAIKHE